MHICMDKCIYYIHIYTYIQRNYIHIYSESASFLKNSNSPLEYIVLGIYVWICT